jgi:uncharacterized membrane protein
MDAHIVCPACHKQKRQNQMLAAELILPHIAQHIQAKKPDWSPHQVVCETCRNEAIAADAQEILEEEMNGQLTDLEHEVINSLRNGGMLAQNLAEMEDDNYLSLTERIAEQVANTIGSFRFASVVLLIVIIWLIYALISGLVESHPAVVFGLLSGALGTLAAIQNPIILMSQRRQARRDRLQSENEYRINLKSELEVRYLNAKLDRILGNVLLEREELSDMSREVTEQDNQKDESL